MDPGTFVEYDMFVEHKCSDFGMQNEKVCVDSESNQIFIGKNYTKNKKLQYSTIQYEITGSILPTQQVISTTISSQQSFICGANRASAGISHKLINDFRH